MLLGAHVSVSGGIHTAIDRAETMGCDAVQLFTQSPRAWRPTNHDPANFERLKERRDEAGIGAVLCHALYLVNLCSPDETIGLDRLRALHVNDSKAALGSNLDRHDNMLEGVLGRKLGVFLAHPAFQGLPAVLEVPGQDGHGPDADEVRKLRELHARWT